jgi:hypothetical protein
VSLALQCVFGPSQQVVHNRILCALDVLGLSRSVRFWLSSNVRLA